MLLVRRCILLCFQPFWRGRAGLLGIVFYVYLWSKGGGLVHCRCLLTPSTTCSGSAAADMALGWKGSHWEYTAVHFSDVLARGALARLVKVTPEQIISTSNLNILKSRNNIESCGLYCKVLLRFLNRVKNKLGIM